MKTINALVSPRQEAQLLELRRQFSRLNTSALKREERRKQRRDLRIELAASQADASESSFQIIVPEPAASPAKGEELIGVIPRKVARLFSVPAGYGLENPRTTSVTVTRKSTMLRTHMARHQKETLRVAC